MPASRFLVESLTFAATSYLCVESGIRITPEAFYDTVKRRNQELFQCSWGASDFRQGMITLGHVFISPNEAFPACADDLLAEAADHSTEVDLAHYAIVHGEVPRLSPSSLARHRWLAGEWSSLLAMGPHKPREPMGAKGMVPMSEKLVDARELAAQISGMVADAVMSKLAAIGLTTENIKKLENLGKVAPLDAQDGASQPASFADMAISKLAAIGLAEQNTKKLVTGGGGTPTLTVGEGSQATTHTPIYSDDDAGNMEIPATLFTEDPFDSVGSCDTLPMQFSRQRKRAAMPEFTIEEEAIFLQPRKRTRHNEVDCEIDEFLMENDEGQVNRFPVFNPSSPASKLPDYAPEDTLLENIQHRDQGEDYLLQGNIRSAIQKLVKNPTAREKSKSQMEAILLIMRKRQDGLIVIRTGGGKSMLWLVPPLLDPEARFIVVCPFTVLLNQQHELAQRHGLHAIKYGVGDIPQDVQILFVQVEHVGCLEFCK